MVNRKSAKFIAGHVQERPHRAGLMIFTNERELVEEALAELTNQCPPFSESKTLVFSETPKSSKPFFYEKT